MDIDSYGEITFSSKDLVREIYKGNLEKISKAKVSPHEVDIVNYLEFIQANGLYDWPVPELKSTVLEQSREQFDHTNQENWLMPDEYRDLDIIGFLLSKCETDEQKERVITELELFAKQDMIPLLRFLKYLVDTMRSNNILWGVGRGSSVASYCLYLLGVHKIDSLKYCLDIREFLR